MKLVFFPILLAFSSGLGLDRETSESVDLGPHLETIAVHGGDLSLEDLRAEPSQMVPNRAQIVHFPIGTKQAWARFVVESADQEDWILHAGFPRPNRLRLHGFDSHGRSQSHSVHLEEALSLGVGRSDPVIPLSQVCQSYPCELWVHFEAHLLRMDLRLMTPGFLEKLRLRQSLAVGLYFGILIALLTYHLILGAVLRERRSLLYALFLLCLGAHIAIRQGVFPLYIWKLSPTFFRQGPAYAATLIVTLAFARAFVSTKTLLPRMDGWMRRTTAVFTALAVGGMLGLRVLPLIFLLGVFSIVLVLVAAWQSFWAGERSALGFLIAMMLLALSSSFATLQALGLVPVFRWIHLALSVSSAAQMILFALALAARIGELREAKERSEHGLLERTLAHERELKQMQERSYVQLLNAVEKERARLSRDLHDGLGHSLLVVKGGIRMFLRRRPELAEDTRVELETLSDSAQACIDEMRGLARSLSPARLEQLGLVGALQAMCSESSRAANIAVEFSAEPSLPPLDSQLGKSAIHVFRIAQEAVLNALKHAKPQKVWLQMLQEGPHLLLRVMDDGVGFRAQFPPRTLGLHGMGERARILNGRLDIHSDSGMGTCVELRIPWENSSISEPSSHGVDEEAWEMKEVS